MQSFYYRVVKRMCLTSDLTSPVNHWMTESSHRSCFTWVQCCYSFALLSGWESRTCASESSQKTAQYHLSQSLQSSSSSSSSSFWAPAHHSHTQHRLQHLRTRGSRQRSVSVTSLRVVSRLGARQSSSDCATKRRTRIKKRFQIFSNIFKVIFVCFI